MILNLINLRDKVDFEEITKLEVEHSILLPSKFKSFAGMFRIGESLFKKDFYFIEKYDKIFECSYVSFPNNLDFELSEFLDLHSIFSHYKLGKGYGNEDHKNNLLKIGTINRGGAIFVGIGTSNYDKIFVNIWDYDPPHYEIASDIFDFVAKCDFKLYKESDLSDNIKYSQFYKNWNDKHWFIKST